MTFIRHDRPRTRGDLLRDAVVYGLLSGWGVWILSSSLRDGVFHLRVTEVHSDSPVYWVLALVLAVLALVPLLLCVEAVIALATGNWKTVVCRDTEGP